MTPSRSELAAACPAASPPAGRDTGSAPDRRVLSFDDLDGWRRDDQDAALTAFRVTSDLLTGPGWQRLDRLARGTADARAFFQSHFRPVLIGGGAPGLFTGYYEPELAGSLIRTDRFSAPIHAAPPELAPGRPWATRAEIEDGQLLAGRGLEIAWLEDPVEAFFLQVQGSGRIRLPDGRLLRVGFAAKNGHPYRSIGRELVRRGLLDGDAVTAGAVKSWLRRHPAEGRALLQHNESYVFFRVLPATSEGTGPLGAMNRPVTAGRSLAVDPDVVPLGAPVWLETDGPSPLRRLMVAQDTGSAIKGCQRADIFCGTGASAGETAGRLRDPGRMVVLLPAVLAT